MRARRAAPAAAAIVVLAALGALTFAACATPREAPMHVTVPSAELAGDPDAITVSWIGHATVLIGIRGHWILTDPVFSDRLAGVMARGVRAAIAPSELPPLDAILISHAHFDHLDLPSLHRLGDAPLLVPPGIPTFLPADLPQHQIVPLDTWQTWRHGDIRITAVPASHGDGRYLVDRWHTRSHTGWIIEVGNRTVYFAGDTGYVAADARELGRRYRIDVGLIPVGPAGRAAWLERMRADVHATPDAALALFHDAGAQWMVPIHFGTFFQPPDRERPLVEAAVARHHLEHQVRILAIGETTTFHY
ncbi:MAG TPA: MBL fold metallo-hydrolase [Kofleriaceae bacterium]|jgi:L-ascorbate metabolism protein UlaG (beta-lactamase superfamily)|nr:MBL fold metallo-hydrolase [Kofleriaceae bacterium]